MKLRLGAYLPPVLPLPFAAVLARGWAFAGVVDFVSAFFGAVFAI